MKTKVEKFTRWEQRVALSEFAEHKMEYLKTAAGAAFLEQLDEFFAPSIAGFARNKKGFYVDKSAVTTLIIDKLLSTLESAGEKSPIQYAIAAEKPYGYLWKTAYHWVAAEWGTIGDDLEHAEWLPAPTPPESDALTTLETVVGLTFEQVADRTDVKYHAEILELLGWLAVNPPQRLSYEGPERVAAHRVAPNLTVEQVTAVMNIAWGGRPRQAESSLMGQYLLDDAFRPSDSPSHARALTYFKNAFRAGENGSRRLTDWGKQ